MYKTSKCEICSEYETKSQKAFNIHIKKHGLNPKEYYDKYINSGNEHKCNNMFCKKESEFIRMHFGYRKSCGSKQCMIELSCWANLRCWMNQGYSKVESIKKRSEWQSNNAKKVDYTHKEKWPTNIQYWINKGFSQDVAEQKLKDRQNTGSLSRFIERHGEIEGRKRFTERQIKWQNTMKSKSPEEKKDIEKRRLTRNGYTVSSVERELKNILKLNENTVQQTLINKNKKFTYDFMINKKIIEYNGDYWHCNPKIYDSNFYNKTMKITAKEKWKKDKVKIDFAKSKGYEVLVIWEYDYKKNRDMIIEKCKEFING